MSKTFLELFNRYVPTDRQARILSAGENLGVKINREKRIAEIRMSFPEPVEKKDLYEIESGVRQAYELSRFVILPSYPPETFSRSYIPQVLTEAERTGIVSRGFFDKYTYELSNGHLTVRIGFSDGGINLLYDARTPGVISNIIQNEFGLTVSTEILRDDNYDEEYARYSSRQNEALKNMYKIGRAHV